MADKRENYQPAPTSLASVGVGDLPSQKSIDLLIRLLQEFESRSKSETSTVPPDVQAAIDQAEAAFAAITAGLALQANPVAITDITPPRGSRAGGTPVTITGANLLRGASVLFGGKPAPAVRDVSLNEIEVTTPEGAIGSVDVVVQTLAGAAQKAGGFTYHQ